MAQSASSGAEKHIRRSVWMFEDLEYSLKLVPDEAERCYGLALVQVMLGKFTDAVKSLKQAVESNPQHLSALSLLGELHFKVGGYEQAAGYLEQVVNLDPDNITAITWLCMAYHCLGHKGKALAKQSLLQNIAPDLVVTLLNK
jgi:tetratricopeptide (TPR) repeat protein